MKIGITVSQKDENSDVDPRFGRAPYIMIYDLKDQSCEFVDNNQNLNQASGAGIQTAQNIARANVEVVLTGNCGPKAFKTLQAADIKVVIGVSGNVTEVIENFKNGEYTYATDANVEGHWV